MTDARRRVLLIAPGCDPDDVAEPWVAYQWVSRLSLRHDVTLLTYHRRDRTPPSRHLPTTRVIEWPDLPLVGQAEQLNNLLQPGYLLFHHRARRWVRHALAAGETFDLAHLLVPVAMRYPNPAAGLGIPSFIGPVGGGLADPPGFRDESSPWYVGLRRLDQIRFRWDPVLRRSYRDAACVLGIAPYVRANLHHCPVQRFETMSETGIERPPDAADRPPKVDGPVRLLYVGRLVRTKGLRDALRALTRLRSTTPWLLDVIGDGFDGPACEALCEQLGLGDRVTFHGRQPRPEVDSFYRRADLFLFPSYREPGGNVVFEAMSFSLPLIVSDRGGPAASVDSSCAITVSPDGGPDAFADRLACALDELLTDPERRLAMGRAARRRVAETALWDQKVEALERLWSEVLSAPVVPAAGARTRARVLSTAGHDGATSAGWAGATG